MGKVFWTYTYLMGLGLVVAILNVVFVPLDVHHPDRFVHVAFLCVAGPLLNIPQVRIEQGRLSLSGTVIGLASSVSVFRRGAFPIVGNAMFSAAIAVAGSLVANFLRREGPFSLVDHLA